MTIYTDKYREHYLPRREALLRRKSDIGQNEARLAGWQTNHAEYLAEHRKIKIFSGLPFASKVPKTAIFCISLNQIFTVLYLTFN